jgi:hypothetical protein
MDQDRGRILRGAGTASSAMGGVKQARRQGFLTIIASYRRVTLYFIEVTGFFDRANFALS